MPPGLEFSPQTSDINTVISLKEHMDAFLERQFSAALEAYRSTLVSVSEHASEICPALGSDIQRSLANLAQELDRNSSPDAFQSSGLKVKGHLKDWGNQTRDYFRQRTDDIKELILVVAETAQSLGERDQRHGRNFRQFIERLRTVADLNDLAEIRQSLARNASELKAYVEAMATDTQKAVAHLQSQVATYQEKLKETERLASVDPLTGLFNRRWLEAHLQGCIAAGQPFAVLMIDLNRFKHINDRYGHPAGDEILKQFAAELKSRLVFPDAAVRWGGDEFVVVANSCAPGTADRTAEWLREWLCGDYAIDFQGTKLKVEVTAAIGAAEWAPGLAPQQLLYEADQAMYRDKTGTSETGANLLSE